MNIAAKNGKKNSFNFLCILLTGEDNRFVILREAAEFAHKGSGHRPSRAG
jgi:hypothetical protein